MLRQKRILTLMTAILIAGIITLAWASNGNDEIVVKKEVAPVAKKLKARIIESEEETRLLERRAIMLNDLNAPPQRP